jgi:hypothetical protein
MGHYLADETIPDKTRARIALQMGAATPSSGRPIVMTNQVAISVSVEGFLARLFLAAVIVASLAGCSTTDTPAPPVAATPPPAGMASITITRASSIMGSMLPVALDLDGKRIADLNVNQTHTMPVKPGSMTLTATMFGYPGRYDLTFTAERAKSYRFIVSPRSESFTAGMVGAAALGVVGSLLVTAAEGNGPFKIEPIN